MNSEIASLPSGFLPKHFRHFSYPGGRGKKGEVSNEQESKGRIRLERNSTHEKHIS